MFKESLIKALPELEDKINDIYEKARPYSEVSKFYQITDPGKKLLEKPVATLVDHAAVDDDADVMIDELQDVSVTLDNLLEMA
jgi:hypothetical protein